MWDLCRALGRNEGILLTPAECIPKPKGMYWRTSERKVEQLKEVDARTQADDAGILDSIKRSVQG